MTVKPCVTICLPQIKEPEPTFEDELFEARLEFPPDAVGNIWRKLRQMGAAQIGTVLDDKFTDNLRYNIQTYLMHLMDTGDLKHFTIEDDPRHINTWLITIELWGLKEQYQYKFSWS